MPEVKRVKYRVFDKNDTGKTFLMGSAINQNEGIKAIHRFLQQTDQPLDSVEMYCVPEQKEYTPQEKEQVGRGLAEILFLTKNGMDKWDTALGRKSPAGIFDLIDRISFEIREGRGLQYGK
jgi:hypothetical protein